MQSTKMSSSTSIIRSQVENLNQLSGLFISEQKRIDDTIGQLSAIHKLKSTLHTFASKRNDFDSKKISLNVGGKHFDFMWSP
jgi:hypothetical protein